MLACACGKKEVVDYDLVDENTEEKDILQQKPEDVEGVEELEELQTKKSIGHYTQEWNFTDENGKNRIVYVDAEAMVPDVTTMEIVEVERRLMDDAFVKQIRKAYLGEEEAVSGYVGEVECTTDVFENVFSTYPLNDTDCYPKSLEGYAQIEQMERYTYDTRATDNYTNECKYSLTEAKAMAEEFLDAIDQDDEWCYEAKSALWTGKTKDEEGTWTTETVSYGYYLTYGVGVDMVAFSQYPHLQQDFHSENSTNGDTISFMITDDGIIKVNIADLVTIRNVSQPVELLPIEDILNIMKEEAAQHFDAFESTGGIQNSTTLSELELIYFGVESKEEDGVYTYVPAWTMGNMYVNAVDGTVEWSPIILTTYLEEMEQSME